MIRPQQQKTDRLFREMHGLYRAGDLDGAVEAANDLMAHVRAGGPGQSSMFREGRTRDATVGAAMGVIECVGRIRERRAVESTAGASVDRG